MFTVVITVVAIICALGWLNQWACSAAIIAYLVDHKINPPEAEIKENLNYVWRKVLRIE